MSSCSGKARYETKEIAKQVLKDIWDRVKAHPEQKKGKVPINCYKCQICGKWHLTSMSKEKQQTMVNPVKQIAEHALSQSFRVKIPSKKVKDVPVRKFKKDHDDDP